MEKSSGSTNPTGPPMPELRCQASQPAAKPAQTGTTLLLVTTSRRDWQCGQFSPLVYAISSVAGTCLPQTGQARFATIRSRRKVFRQNENSQDSANRAQVKAPIGVSRLAQIPRGGASDRYGPRALAGDRPAARFAPLGLGPRQSHGRAPGRRKVRRCPLQDD